MSGNAAAPSRLVLVEWEDADEVAGWFSVDEGHKSAAGTDPKPTIVHSVGFVIQETSERITLVSSIVKGGFGAILRIPNGMIRSVRLLRKGPPA